MSEVVPPSRPPGLTGAREATPGDDDAVADDAAPAAPEAARTETASKEPDVEDLPSVEPPEVVVPGEAAIVDPGDEATSDRPPASPPRVNEAELTTPPASQRRRDSAPAAPRTASPLRATPYPLAGLPSQPEIPPARSAVAAHLSPRMTAIFGGLFGLACITSVVALLIQVVPPKDDRSAAANGAAGAKASGSARAANAPVAKAKKKRTPIPGPWRLAELAKDPSVQIITGTPEKKSFVDALTDKGVPTSQVYRLMKALDDIKKFDKVGHKDKFTVALEKGEKKVKAFEYEVTPSEIYQAREGNDGLLAGSKLDMKLAEEEMVGAFYVGSDAEKSAEFAGFEDGILNAIDEAFQGRISHENFEEGSVVRVVAIEETALGLFSRYKRIVAVEYKPQEPSAQPTRAYSFTGQDAKGYFDEKGKQPFSGGWQPPLVGGLVVTSPFNPHRMHPVLHKLMPHEGTDLRASTGTPVFSAYHGVVSSAGPLGPCGNAVVIDHPGGIQTGYCHLSKVAGDIKAGDKIGVHHQIGLAGQTGRASGPHLHFFAKRNGKFFDAMTLKLNGERVMPPIDRPGFAVAKADLDKRLEAIPMPEPPPEKPKAAVAAAPSGSARAGAATAAAETEKEAGEGPTKGDKPTHSARQVASPAAIASAAAQPGIHPSTLVEDDADDDGM